MYSVGTEVETQVQVKRSLSLLVQSTVWSSLHLLSFISFHLLISFHSVSDHPPHLFCSSAKAIGRLLEWPYLLVFLHFQCLSPVLSSHHLIGFSSSSSLVISCPSCLCSSFDYLASISCESRLREHSRQNKVH